MVVGVLFLAISLAQSPGLIEFDTRLPMIMSPIAYFGSVLHLWNPVVFGGTVEQGSGFLIPQGLYFIGTSLLHVPVWIAERIWLALLLTVGCWGIIRLAEALGIGNRWSRVLAGVAYCAAPIVVTWVSLSGDLLAVVLLPWMLLPLVVGSRTGSPLQAAARSGIAVALMGGSNAAVVLAVLPVGVIWLLTREPGRRRRSLAFWWVCSVFAGCAFWLVSLVFVAHFGYNYLAQTETSVTTTSTASAFEAFRGASDWLSYYDIGGPLIRGSWTLVTAPAIVVATTVVTALGLAGLCRKLPERMFLVLTLTFGVVVIAAGYAGPLGGAFSHSVQNLLQGALAPFRNVSKFSPVVTLPVVLGFAWMAPRVPSAMAGMRRLRSPFGWAARVGAVLALIGAVILAATPFWQGQLYPVGGFSAIPSYWVQAGNFLNDHQGHNNALLVPGSSFADYTWGDPNDEPLQVVASTSLEWRNIIPLGSNGYTQMLDTVEQALDQGITTPGLSGFLALQGVDYVVERNDLNLKETGAPPPAQVHQVLGETPGLTEVASFGPYLPARQVAYGHIPVYDDPNYLHLRAVNIYRVDGAPHAVQAYPARDPVVVSGDVGSAIPLVSAGLLQNRAYVLAGDEASAGVAGAPQATWAITDGNQRRATTFGSIRYNESYLLGPTQTLPGRLSALPLSFAVVNGVQHQTVAEPRGATSVSASGFGGSPFVSSPGYGPASAFDDDPNTEWIAPDIDNSVGQWISISFLRPIQLSSIVVTPKQGTFTITKVWITTDRGTVLRVLPPGRKSYRLSVAPGKSKHIRLTIAGVRVNHRGIERATGVVPLGAGISGISIPGISFEPRMLLPDDESATFSKPDAQPAVVSFQRPLSNENISLSLSSTDDPNMARLFTVPKSEDVSGSGYAVPVPSESLNSLIARVEAFLRVWDAKPGTSPTPGLQITASSVLGGLPRFTPENLVDGAALPWIAQIGDHSPSLLVGWQGEQTVHQLVLSPSKVAARPTEVRITPASAGGRSFIAKVPRDGVITFPEVTTDALDIRFIKSTRQTFVAPNLVSGLQLPVGLSAIRVQGLKTSPISQPNLHRSFTLPCGAGPAVKIDGANYETSASGTLGDLVDLRPMRIALCASSGAVSLRTGRHNFSSTTLLGPFQVSSFTLAPKSVGAATGAEHRTVSVKRWTADSRTIAVGRGPTTFLVVAQNYNPAWVATMNGRTLKAVELNGWEQGFVVPAGRAGAVTLSVPADGAYRLLLVLAALLLLGLLVLAIVPLRKRYLPAARARAVPALALLVLGAIALVAIGGVLALVLVPLLLIARRWGSRPMALVAFIAFVVAGIAAAIGPAPALGTGFVPFDSISQTASVLALGAILTSAVAAALKKADADTSMTTQEDGDWIPDLEPS
ncbi:MAG: alpha-(1-_3)-arabinofuranosyltransferase family protein [Acidimicrobiales bacterium]